MLDVRGVTVRAGRRSLLADVGFSAEAGEIVAVFGPNGAGKTTLLEVLVGLRRASSETVAWNGRVLRTFHERARTFAFLPDGGALPSELEVRDVVTHALRFRARSSALVGELRQALGVDALLSMAAGVLSRGERQRVALFCALAVDRPVVVLDEPFSAFDPLQLRDVMRAVRRVAECGAAVVATVHQLRDAERLAHRMMLLASGRRVAWGDLSALREQAGRPDADLEQVFTTLLDPDGHAT
jgi:ABC-type multidrug transport system ATPase subunit